MHQMHQLFLEISSAQKAPHDNRSCQGGLYLPATRSLSQCCQDNSLVSRSGRLGDQLWGVAPDFAATFSTGFTFRKIFRERLRSGIADYRRDVYDQSATSLQVSIRLLMRHRLIQRHTGETSHGRDRRKRTGLLKSVKAGSPGLDLGV